LSRRHRYKALLTAWSLRGYLAPRQHAKVDRF
jgi:hypothetical protein